MTFKKGIRSAGETTEGDKSSSQGAFVFYRPGTSDEGELLFYNEEAWHVLSRSAPDPADKPGICSHVSTLCLKWLNLLGKVPDTPGGDPGSDFVDTLQSGNRRYIVRSIVLSESVSAAPPGRKYLFIMERGSPEKIKLLMSFRKLALNRREQQIVELLLSGSANKEIADSLGISLNTVKGYLKLLSRKLGVNSRAEIIASVLASK